MDPTNANTALASAIAEELARCGVTRAVVSPGSRSTPLAMALFVQPGIDITVIVDERSAGFFALGIGAADGVPAAVVCTSGSAAANLHPAVVEADEGGAPMIVITADRPPELRQVGAGQTIDQLKLYGSSPRWFCDLGTNDADDQGLLHVRSSACRAFAAARGEPRPGPVHLNAAFRDPLDPEPRPGEVTAGSPLALHGRANRPLTSVSRLGAGVDPAELETVAERLLAAERPMILAGRQTQSELAEPVALIAGAIGAPILAEPTSQIRSGGHDRALVVSHYDALTRIAGVELEPDLVLRFGELPTSKPLRRWLAGFDCEQIVVDGEGGWYEPTRVANRIVRENALAMSSALSSRLVSRAEPALQAGRAGWAHTWTEADRLAGEAIAAELETATELTEPGVQRVLAASLTGRANVFAASSMPVRDLEAFTPSLGIDVRYFANRGANGIDGSISTAAGIALATGVPSWAVVGDLALLHDSNGLAALREALNLRVLVVDNRGGGIFSFLPQAETMPADAYERLMATPARLDVEALGAAHGLRVARAGTPSALADALRGDAEVVHADVLDRDANRLLHDRLAVAVADAITRA
ncbi:2-succinyl-5-enolpyruvyl-6-hydroxy-3-cyclohexene-1-carboxylic-acid synthase [Thermoleophilia bacterium SCSIO 60948]|nr:2-succinyl-5-enolpyruvyl-6-hydroxy-3-cyclohexene-1-carboxylic-acid synthase [Thermoleophilia bacterium SCSIO 60948]